jgi:hypothetical protein
MGYVKQHLFTIVIALGVLLGVGFFVAKILPQFQELSRLKWRLEGKRKARTEIIKTATKAAQLYSKKDITYLKDLLKELQTDHKKIIQFYADYDKQLEQWFEGLQEGFTIARFQSSYKDKQVELDKTIKGLGLIRPKITDSRGPRRLEKPNPLNWEGIDLCEEIQSCKVIQKRYWIRKRVVNVIQEWLKGVPQDMRKGIYLEDMTFLSSPPGFKSPSSSDASEYPAYRKGIEYTFPLGIGETISFGLKLTLPYQEIPRFMDTMLNVEQTPKMLVNLAGFSMQVIHEMPKEIGTQKEFRTRQKPVRTMFTFQVLDIDTQRLKEPIFSESSGE